MQIIQKKLIKEILRKSPDRADACAFNFYEQIRRNFFDRGAIKAPTWSPYDL